MKAHLQSKVLLILFLACLVVIPVGVFSAEDWRVLLARSTGGGLVSTGGDYQLAGAVGQADAWRLRGMGYRLNGGVMGELIRTGSMQLFVPLTMRRYPLTTYESEPNNYFDQANTLDLLPVRVFGNHDGAAGTGDVYLLILAAGQDAKANLFANNSNGVQFLAYDSAGSEIGRDFESPFSLSFTATYDGLYYLYVYTPAEAANSDSYEMVVWLGKQIVLESVPAPTMDADQLEQAPLINP